jgi:DNA mismatch endonuclease, patch repair protein
MKTPDRTPTTPQRSNTMRQITSKNTSPERIVRSVLHRLGYRFRIHSSKLPGKPDIVLRKYHTVIFVHGCFWHQHEGCKYSHKPRSNNDYWDGKLARNVSRFEIQKRNLENAGWNVQIVWECETKDAISLAQTLTKMMPRKIPVE